jgi:hypothetical protein
MPHGLGQHIDLKRAVRKLGENLQVFSHAPADEHLRKGVRNVLKDLASHPLLALCHDRDLVRL